MTFRCLQIAHNRKFESSAARKRFYYLHLIRSYGILLLQPEKICARRQGLKLNELKQSPSHHNPHWTKAVHAYAKEFFSGYVVDTDENAIVFFLRGAGFDHGLSEEVACWLHQCERMGTLSEVLAMYKPMHSVRVVTPIEKIIPQKILKTLKEWQKKGYISHDLFEKVLEVLRTSDPRDWDEDDVKFFLSDLIENVRPTLGDSLTEATLNATNTGRKPRNNPHH